MFNPIRSVIGNVPNAQPTPPGAPQGGAGFNPAAAGNKVYGSGQPMPTVGAVSNMAGYGQRDAKMAARRQALLNRAQGGVQLG